MNFLKILLMALLIIKIGWVIAMGVLLLVKHDIISHGSDLVEQVETIEHRLHLTLTFLIGTLLVYLFNHLTSTRVCIDGHEKMYLYTFGILAAIGSVKKIAYEFLTVKHI
jgi:hypothetical protein